MTHLSRGAIWTSL